MRVAHEKANVALLVIGQILFLITSITVMTLSGVVGLQLAPTPSLATLPITGMMLGALVFTLPASLLMKRIGRRLGFLLADIATVMQWHVVGMFAPSFVTGSLIGHFGVYRIIVVGSLLLMSAFVAALFGATLGHFLLALVLLGIGWNFLFIGGSHLLTQAHRPSERSLVQGINDFLVFAMVALGSLLAGVLFAALGWNGIQWLMLPFALVTALLVWRQSRQVSASL